MYLLGGGKARTPFLKIWDFQFGLHFRALHYSKALLLLIVCPKGNATSQGRTSGDSVLASDHLLLASTTHSKRSNYYEVGEGCHGILPSFTRR